jgi:hypothetical protein
MIDSGRPVQVAYALKWKDCSGALSFRDLLLTAQELGIELRSNGSPIKLAPM